MATPTKTIQTALHSLQTLASNSVVISSAFDVSTKFAATVFCHFGRAADTALTEGAEFRIEASAQASGDGHWFTVAAFKSKIAAITSRAVTTSSASGQKVVTMTTTTGCTVGDIVFIKNTTIGNSEWARIAVVSAGASITLEDNLINTQGTSSVVYQSGEFYAAQIDCMAITRLRCVVNGDNTGQTVALEVELITCDSIA